MRSVMYFHIGDEKIKLKYGDTFEIAGKKFMYEGAEFNKSDDKVQYSVFLDSAEKDPEVEDRETVNESGVTEKFFYWNKDIVPIGGILRHVESKEILGLICGVHNDVDDGLRVAIIRGSNPLSASFKSLYEFFEWQYPGKRKWHPCDKQNCRLS